MSSPTRALAWCVPLVVASQFLTGCIHWRVDPTPLPARLASSPPSDIRIRLRDGRQLDLNGPSIVRDTLHGYLAGAQPFSVPVGDVSQYATRKAGVSKWILIPVLAVSIPLLLLTLFVPKDTS